MSVIGILGAGNVARALAPALSAAGHDVVVGTRDRLAATAESAEIAVNALPGAVSVEVLGRLRPMLDGKVLLDVANAVEQGPDGFASRLLYRNLAQELQRTLPGSRVVKALNTVGPAPLMAAPGGLAVPPSTFLCGDDPGARRTVAGLLADLGWPSRSVVDLGGVANAWWPESFVLMIRPLVAALGPVPFALTIAR
ncbi:NAD(P)-binding domain-containing protein [Dactylosporangium fulvum]|uniref:NAD(P)-binding domain-containing protein n=1 Tax=Dactylosporangium fulvum TaxID=53359 RepID=A0ABY5W7L8_9ACTN|nr:NAD(P)-binding domain-containing protein [Dactylosporangium fulvum]UWP86035.1 NAD(P)-binding domain-containing protein [Dactylosporangium fulvum]